MVGNSDVGIERQDPFVSSAVLQSFVSKPLIPPSLLCVSMLPAETPVFNQSIDPVYELLRKAVDAGRRSGQGSPMVGSAIGSHDKPFSTTADRNWSQVIGQMGILPPSSSHHVPRARSSASSSGSSSCASAHLLSVLNSQPASSSGNFPFFPPVHIHVIILCHNHRRMIRLAVHYPALMSTRLVCCNKVCHSFLHTG